MYPFRITRDAVLQGVLMNAMMADGVLRSLHSMDFVRHTPESGRENCSEAVMLLTFERYLIARLDA